MELVQRTNQLNFSGTRYSRGDLEAAASRPDTVPVVMRCSDRFGDYGLVGFALLAKHFEESKVPAALLRPASEHL